MNSDTSYCTNLRCASFLWGKQVLREQDTDGPIISNTEAKCVTETPRYRGAQKPVGKVYTAVRLGGITTSGLCAARGVRKPAIMVTVRDLGQGVQCASWVPKFSSLEHKTARKKRLYGSTLA
jgi:hypothetical protein